VLVGFKRKTRSYAERCDGDILELKGRVFVIDGGDFQEIDEATGRNIGDLLGPEEVAELVGVKADDVYNTLLVYLV